MPPPNGLAVMRTRAYLGVLVLAVVLGVPIAAFAYGFLKLTVAGAAVDLHRPAEGARLRDRADLVAAAAAGGWPGLLTALTIRYLPGTRRRVARRRVQPAAGAAARRTLPGIFLRSPGRASGWAPSSGRRCR